MPVLGGQQCRGPRGFEVRADDERARPRRADGVERRGGAAEPLVDLELGVQPQTRKQHRRVAALQEWEVPADQNDPFDAATGLQRCPTRLDGHRDGVLVVTGHPTCGVPQHGR